MIHIIIIKPFKEPSCPVWDHLHSLCSLIYTDFSFNLSPVRRYSDRPLHRIMAQNDVFTGQNPRNVQISSAQIARPLQTESIIFDLPGTIEVFSISNIHAHTLAAGEILL